METVLTSSCLKTRSSVEEGSGWHWAACHDPWCLFTCNCQTCCEYFCLWELTCMHCVYLALWTCKVLCGSFLCAIYYIYYNNNFSCIHVRHMLPDFQAFKNCIHVHLYHKMLNLIIILCVCLFVCLLIAFIYIYSSWADSLHLYVILHECIVKYVGWIGVISISLCASFFFFILIHVLYFDSLFWGDGEWQAGVLQTEDSWFSKAWGCKCVDKIHYMVLSNIQLRRYWW